MSSIDPPSDPRPDYPAGERLDSWKEIAAYLKRSVRSVQRWEAEEGMPVRRHLHDKRGTIYGFKPELDAWWKERGAILVDRNGEEEIESLPAPEPAALVPDPTIEVVPTSRRHWRAALIGTGVGLSILFVAVVAWLSRNGSGPSAGSTRPPFQARDWVLVSSFENRSGQPLFDWALEYALTRELSNSRYVNVVPRERVSDALRLMRKPLDTRVGAGIGREICLRDGGIRALITGRIEKFGPKYLLSLELVDPRQGASTASVTEEAVGDEDLMPATKRISDEVRTILGEKLPIPGHDEGDLSKVTTSSLRSLQLYSQADTLIAQGNSAASEELLKQAVAEDPEFASAHIHLAHAIRNQGRPKAEYLPAAETAFRLSDGTTERERYFIRGSYYDFLGEKDKAVAGYEALLSLYPDHFWATNNLIDFYIDLGRDDDAARCAVRRADLRPKDFEARFWAAWYLSRVERDPLRTSLYVRQALEIASPDVLREFPSQVAWLELYPANERWLAGDVRGAVALASRFAGKLDAVPMLHQYGAIEQLGNIFLTAGKLGAADELFRRLSDPTFNLTGLSLVRGDREELKRLSTALVLRSRAPISAVLIVLLTRSGLAGEAEQVLARSKGWEASAVAGTPEAARGELAMARGRTAEAIALLRESERKTRFLGNATFLLGMETLASALARRGDLGGAIAVLERGSKQRRQVAFHWVSNGFLWERNQLLLARLYRKASRVAEAQRIEAELSRLLALADADHPLLLELGRLQRS
jgi:tetratricopeptide (TPR) repeat protein